jgi:hypothetical protein
VLRLETEEVVVGIELYTSSGQLVPLQWSRSKEIDVKAVPVGAYVLRVITEKGAWSSPLIKH